MRGTRFVHVLHPVRFGVVVNQTVAASGNAVLGNFGCDLVDPRTEEFFPVVWLHAIHCLNQIVESVSHRNVAAIIDSEKQLGKIVERFLPLPSSRILVSASSQIRSDSG